MLLKEDHPYWDAPTDALYQTQAEPISVIDGLREGFIHRQTVWLADTLRSDWQTGGEIIKDGRTDERNERERAQAGRELYKEVREREKTDRPRWGDLNDSILCQLYWTPIAVVFAGRDKQ